MKASQEFLPVGVLAFLWLASGVSLAQAPGKSLPEKMSVDLGAEVKMQFVLIHPGRFMMGSEKGDADEKPVHEVRITKPFYMGVHEVTQAQWKALMGDAPAYIKGDDLPFDSVSWEDCQSFLAKLKEKLSAGLTCRLPTEAEWEYACRAGSQGEYCFGDDERALGEYASSFDSKIHPVGQKKPNTWGLYDMHGNIWEWCADWFEEGYYAKSPAEDPKGPTSGKFRVLRGGSSYDDAHSARSASRFRDPPEDRLPYYHGFRVVVSP